MDNSFSRILKNAIFEIYPKEAQTSTKLKAWIQRLGGICIISETDDHSHKESFAIPLIDLAWCKVHNTPVFHKPKEHKFQDFYSSTFIYECYREKQRLDLNSYRLGRSSLITYDANLFLDQKLSWCELLAKSCQIVLKEYEHNDSNQNSDTNPGKEKQDDEKRMDEDAQSEYEYQRQSQQEGQELEERITGDKEEEEEVEEVGIIVNNGILIPSTSSSSSTRTPTVMLCRIDKGDAISQIRNIRRNAGKISSCNRFRRNRLKPPSQSKQLVRTKGVPYSRDDSQKLLEYICNNNLHNATGGNLMWKYIEAQTILSVPRTNQSIKEHFRRQILPNLKNYYISPEDVLKFDNARKEREKGRRKPIMFIPS